MRGTTTVWLLTHDTEEGAVDVQVHGLLRDVVAALPAPMPWVRTPAGFYVWDESPVTRWSATPHTLEVTIQ